jgi:hypothetical protein
MVAKLIGFLFLINISFLNAAEIPGVPMDEYLDPTRAEDYCAQEPWILTDIERANIRGKFGLIPARFLYQASIADQQGFTKVAEDNRMAAKVAGRVYHKQMQKSFRYLNSIMNRTQIGMYAQSMWVNITKPMEKVGASPFLYVQSEKFEMMDAEMKELARKRVYMNTKWMALVINEIPVY